MVITVKHRNPILIGRRKSTLRVMIGQVIEDATLDDLDEVAIRLACEGYKNHYPELPKVCDKCRDEVFLETARLTIDGRITRTTLLLVWK